MSSTRNHPFRFLATMVATQARMPLIRNGYALVISTVATSVFGLIYWILAARFYSPNEVGLNAAVLSAALFLSNIAQFDFYHALNRFLPSAGASTRRLILAAYFISSAMAVLVSAVFLLGLFFFAPKLSFLSADPRLVVRFMLFTVVWGIFALQDSVMIGIHQAVWVPVENILFAIIKVILLVVLAFFLPYMGVMASWGISIAVAVLVVNFFLFTILIPRHMRSPDTPHEHITWRQIVQYITGEYLGALFWVGITTLQPVIVTQVAGTTVNAYFYLAWQISFGLYLISRMMGMALVAEGAKQPSRLTIYSLSILKQIAILILPAVALILIGAPLILRLYGPDYAAAAAPLLRLLSLSALPQAIIVLYLCIARVQRQIWALVLVQAAESILALALLFIFLGRFGISGIGWAWLISQTLVAGTLILIKLPNILLMNLDLRAPLQVLNILTGLQTRKEAKKGIARANTILEQISSELDGLSLDPSWKGLQVISTVTDVTVVALGPDSRTPQALLKLANSSNAAADLQHQTRVLTDLRAEPRLNGWHTLLPSLIVQGQAGGHFYVIESMLPGVDARQVLKYPDTRTLMLAAAALTIEDLHQRTSVTVQANPDLLHIWIDQRVQAIQACTTSSLKSNRYEDTFQYLRDELYRSIGGREVPVSWIHGDYGPGNILVTPNGEKVVGVVDWGQASPVDLPSLDLVHLLLSTRMYLQGRELGDIIRRLLNGEKWTDEELAILMREQRNLAGEPVDMRSLLILAWLRHIASNLNKSPHYAKNWLWVTRNIRGVLEAL